MKTRIVPLKNSRPALRTVLILNPIVVVCFGLAPTLWAVSPTPDGSYPGGNTAEGGSGALFSLTTGSNNTAVGSQALLSVTNGSQNTAIGAQALKDNLASQNTADGFQALTRNIAGDGNTATGWRALFTNTSGDRNTADGNGALYKNTGGSDNTATGFQALYNNSTGSRNTAYGSGAIVGGGNDNTAVGSGALGVTNVSSNENTALGSRALASNVGAMTTQPQAPMRYCATTVAVTRSTVQTRYFDVQISALPPAVAITRLWVRTRSVVIPVVQFKTTRSLVRRRFHWRMVGRTTSQSGTKLAPICRSAITTLKLAMPDSPRVRKPHHPNWRCSDESVYRWDSRGNNPKR